MKMPQRTKKGRLKRGFMDVIEEDMEEAGVTGDTGDGLRWLTLATCNGQAKGTLHHRSSKG